MAAVTVAFTVALTVVGREIVLAGADGSGQKKMDPSGKDRPMGKAWMTRTNKAWDGLSRGGRHPAGR